MKFYLFLSGSFLCVYLASCSTPWERGHEQYEGRFAEPTSSGVDSEKTRRVVELGSDIPGYLQLCRHHSDCVRFGTCRNYICQNTKLFCSNESDCREVGRCVSHEEIANNEVVQRDFCEYKK